MSNRTSRTGKHHRSKLSNRHLQQYIADQSVRLAKQNPGQFYIKSGIHKGKTVKHICTHNPALARYFIETLNHDHLLYIALSKFISQLATDIMYTDKFTECTHKDDKRYNHKLDCNDVIDVNVILKLYDTIKCTPKPSTPHPSRKILQRKKLNPDAEVICPDDIPAVDATGSCSVDATAPDETETAAKDEIIAAIKANDKWWDGL